MSDSADLFSIVRLSLLVSGTAVLLSSAVGVPLGAIVGLTNFRGKRLMTIVLNTGMALPPVVVGLVLYLLLSRSGPLGGMGWLFTPAAMIVAQTILCFPFVAGITLSAVAAVPAEFQLQLRGLGATPWQARWTVLREARAGVAVAIAAAFGRAISEVGAVLIVGGNIAGHTRVLTTAIVLETGKGEFAFALTLGAFLLAIALGVNFVCLHLQGRPAA